MRLALVNRCKQDHKNCLVRQDDYKVPGMAYMNDMSRV